MWCTATYFPQPTGHSLRPHPLVVDTSISSAAASGGGTRESRHRLACRSTSSAAQSTPQTGHCTAAAAAGGAGGASWGTSALWTCGCAVLSASATCRQSSSCADADVATTAAAAATATAPSRSGSGSDSPKRCRTSAPKKAPRLTVGGRATPCERGRGAGRSALLWDQSSDPSSCNSRIACRTAARFRRRASTGPTSGRSRALGRTGAVATGFGRGPRSSLGATGAADGGSAADLNPSF
mmetsp:Transcript_25944/g.44096  ORF Transcript_25944/g.44096 Transcript_25944/m.44096 type:complete len:239 (-) Transcript_25944:239-955(-)